MLGKPAFNDVKEGIITAPLVYGLLEFKKINQEDFLAMGDIINRQFSNPIKDVPIGVDLLFKSSGIELADKLSLDHISEGIDQLKEMRYSSQNDSSIVIDFENEPHAQALIGLALKVKTRKY